MAKVASDQSRPDPVIQTLVDGSQITVDTSEMEKAREQETKPSTTQTSSGETSVHKHHVSSENGLDIAPGDDGR